MTFANTATAARETYAARGAALMEGLIPADVARSVTFQAQLLAGKKNGPALAAPSVSTRPTYEIYGYFWPNLTGLHWGLTPALEAATGARLLPTYAYFRTYQQGDTCKVHVDRPSCEHSVSLTIGYSDDMPWALCIGTRPWRADEMRARPLADGFDGEDFTRLAMRPGDAVLYKGVDYRHGRVDPNPNRWSAHLFLHWVSADGPYAEWAFDKQTVTGEGDFVFPPA